MRLCHRLIIQFAMSSLSLLFMVTSLSSSAQDEQTSTKPATIDVSKKPDPLPLQDLRLFTLVFDHIRRSYVEPVSDKELLDNAIKGMLNELDPHSDYLDAQHYSALQETTQGEFSGVGLEIGLENGYIKIITPIDDTPAAKAGLQAGDVITKLDNQPIQGLSLSEAAERMRGPEGTEVVFTIVRQGADKPIQVTVVRGKIRTRSVRARVIDDQFAYIRIAQFQAKTGEEFIEELESLFDKNNGLKGLVLDLRNNPGGVLQSSIVVVDSLINEGRIVYTEGRLANSDQAFFAEPGDIAKGLPIVALINGGSASAAEIVAGALQDHKRAVIMGTRSFGKGSVQTILPIAENKGIKLTTARYFTPNGRSIQAEGITPDVVIKRAKITQITGDEQQVKEADLTGHLENQNKEKPNQKDGRLATNNNDIEDNQLFEAINMLKGLAIFQTATRQTNATETTTNQ